MRTWELMAWTAVVSAALIGCGDGKDESGGGNPLNALDPGASQATNEAGGGSTKSAQAPSTGASDGGVAAGAATAPAAALGKFGALATRICACPDKACSDKVMVEFEQLSGSLASRKLSDADTAILQASSDKIALCAAVLAATPEPGDRGDAPGAALGDAAKLVDAIGKHSALADSVCACKDKSCADAVNTQLSDLLNQTASLAFAQDDQQKIKIAGEKFNGCYLDLVIAGVATTPAGTAKTKTGGLGLTTGVPGVPGAQAPQPTTKNTKPSAVAKSTKPARRKARPGRRGHQKCPAGKYMWGGKCDGPRYFKNVASRRSRIYFSTGKDCPPGIRHRKGTYCYACAAGTLWKKGGACVRRCAGQASRGERKCTMIAGRKGHEKCPPGKYMWGGKCDGRSYFRSIARKKSRIYFAAGKDCPPGFRNRSSTYCYACAFGTYWNKGKCIARCASGTDYAKRQCRASSPGRRGHSSCAAGTFMYAGKCTPSSYFHKLAARKSRIFFGSSKDCPPGFRNRSTTYCYACSFGSYWNRGRCVNRCRGGADATERKCTAAGGSARKPSHANTPRRRGHVACAPGQSMYAGKCTPADYFHRLASRKSKMFFGRSKACPPGFPHRQGSNCFVCRPGQYWNSGGCVGRCSGGTDLVNRKCR